MDISVIVVTYNQEATIARTLDSILAQDFRGSMEIIVGDDCSTDGTSSICQEYAHRYPGVVRHVRREKNLGVCVNYFDCIERASGRYLADCAGDDFWVDVHKLQLEFDELEANPEVSMVTTDWLCCDTDGSNVRRHPAQPEVGRRKIYQRGELSGDILSTRRTLHLCTALYRRDLLLQAMKGVESVFVSPKYSCEDQQILMAMAASGKIVVRPEVTLLYSVGHDSISHREDYMRQFDYSLKGLRQMLIWQKHFGVSSTDMAGMYKSRISSMASIIFHHGSNGMLKELKTLIAQNGVAIGIKAKIYMKIAEWRTGCLRRLFGRRKGKT